LFEEHCQDREKDLKSFKSLKLESSILAKRKQEAARRQKSEKSSGKTFKNQ